MVGGTHSLKHWEGWEVWSSGGSAPLEADLKVHSRPHTSSPLFLLCAPINDVIDLSVSCCLLVYCPLNDTLTSLERWLSGEPLSALAEDHMVSRGYS